MILPPSIGPSRTSMILKNMMLPPSIGPSRTSMILKNRNRYGTACQSLDRIGFVGNEVGFAYN
jgi:hypothetical protein